MHNVQAVTFGVNAYAYAATPSAAATERVSALMAAEQQAGLLPMLHPIVALEQLALLPNWTRHFSEGMMPFTRRSVHGNGAARSGWAAAVHGGV
jgi:hypothetical protein